MWFRPGGSSSSASGGTDDRFRVSSFRSRIRGRKPSSAVAATNGTDKPVKSATGKQLMSKDGQSSAKSALDTSTSSCSFSSAGTGTENDSMEMPSDGLIVNQVIRDSRAANSAVVVEHVEAVEEEEAQLEQKEIKDQVILTDPKYKANRIEKSSSRSRVVPLTSRKISAPPVMMDANRAGTTGSDLGTSVIVMAPKKNARSHSHLNLNSLLKYKSLLYAGTSEKKLTSEDFDKMRKKSMSEVAKAAQPNSDATANSTVKLIRHEFIDEVDVTAKIGTGDKKRSAGKMSLSDKVAAKLNESKKKAAAAAASSRSKSKTRKRRNSRRSSCNNSAVNIPTVLANKVDLDVGEGETNVKWDENENEDVEGPDMFLMGWWISLICLRNEIVTSNFHNISQLHFTNLILFRFRSCRSTGLISYETTV